MIRFGKKGLARKVNGWVKQGREERGLGRGRGKSRGPFADLRTTMQGGSSGAPGGGSHLPREGEDPGRNDWRPEVQGSRQQGCCAPRQKRGLGKEGAGLLSGLMVRGQQAEPAPAAASRGPSMTRESWLHKR